MTDNTPAPMACVFPTGPGELPYYCETHGDIRDQLAEPRCRTAARDTPAPVCTCGPWTVEGDPMFRTSRGAWHKGSCPLHYDSDPDTGRSVPDNPHPDSVTPWDDGYLRGFADGRKWESARSVPDNAALREVDRLLMAIEPVEYPMPLLAVWRDRVRPTLVAALAAAPASPAGLDVERLHRAAHGLFALDVAQWLAREYAALASTEKAP